MEFFKKWIEKRKEKRFVDISDQDFTVTLKPLLGISPKIYLRILLSLLVLILLFLLLFLPGIQKNGSVVKLTSEPSNSAVYIDNKYAGATPLKVFVPKGEHSFSLQYSGAEENTLTKKIKGRIFFSLFAPKREKIHFEVANINPSLTAQNLISQFDKITCYHSFEKGTLPPPFVTHSVEQILASKDKMLQESILNQLFNHVLVLANTPELKKDCFQALLLASGAKSDEIQSKKRQLTTDVLTKASDKILNLSYSYPQLFFDYYTLFTPNERKLIKTFPNYLEYQQALIKYCNLPTTNNFGNPTGRKITKGGQTLYEYQGGYFRQNDQITTDVIIKLSENEYPPLIPHLYYIPNFYIAEEPVSGNQFSQFIENHPQLPNEWEFSNKINRFYRPTKGKAPILGISWYAANEYAKSKGCRLPYSFELDQIEFETKVKIGIEPQEWCMDSYLPSCMILSTEFPERIIKIKREKETKNIQNTSLPANFCTDYATFRLAYSSSLMQLINLKKVK